MAKDFSGSNQYATYTTDSFDMSADTITVSAWFEPDSTAGRRAFNARDSGGRACIIGVNGDGGTYLHAVAGSGSELNNKLRASYGGGWKHLVFQTTAGSSPGMSAAYLNGTAMTDTTGGGWGHSGSAGVRVGSRLDSGTGYDGRMAEVAMWKNFTLTAEVAESLANGYSPLFFRNGLILYTQLLKSYVNVVNAAAASVVGSAGDSAHPRIIYPQSRQIFVPSAAAPPATTILPFVNHYMLG